MWGLLHARSETHGDNLRGKRRITVGDYILWQIRLAGQDLRHCVGGVKGNCCEIITSAWTDACNQSAEDIPALIGNFGGNQAEDGDETAALKEPAPATKKTKSSVTEHGFQQWETDLWLKRKIDKACLSGSFLPSPWRPDSLLTWPWS